MIVRLGPDASMSVPASRCRPVTTSVKLPVGSQAAGVHRRSWSKKELMMRSKTVVPTLLLLAMLAVSAGTSGASCPSVHPDLVITSVNGTPVSTDQATLSVGDCATLRLVVV